MEGTPYHKRAKTTTMIAVGVIVLALAVLVGYRSGQGLSNALQHTAMAASVEHAKLPTAYRVITILPGMKLGPDGKLHDAFSPANLHVTKGQRVVVTAYNYDNMKHSFTSAALGINEQLQASPKNGEPGVTKFAFTINKTGGYTFQCIDPCDMSNGGWSMGYDGYMIGKVLVSTG